MRIAILGNSGGGKSTLARRLARTHELPLYEVDKLLWRSGWVTASEQAYGSEHAAILVQRGNPKSPLIAVLRCTISLESSALCEQTDESFVCSRALARPAWRIDGVGRPDSIPARIARATMVILIDLPLWQHFWLAAERQIAWAEGELEHPAGLPEMPPTRALFETIWMLDRDWLPQIRRWVAEAEASGTEVRRITDVEGLCAATFDEPARSRA